MSDLRIDPLDDATFDDAWRVVEQAFGEAPHDSEREVERAVVEPERFLLARDGDEPVATAGAFSLRMTLPGGAQPVAGVTWVGVLPTHRRRGLLTRMMARVLADAHARGEAVAALWATQAEIYGRFGFAPASWHHVVDVPSRARTHGEPPRGGVRLVAPQADLLAPLLDAWAAATPGAVHRSPSFWANRLHDSEHRRGGASPLRCVVTDAGDGYALYDTRPAWGALPGGVVDVKELVALTPDAHSRLWRHVLDHDLLSTVHARLALDDPLLQLLVEPRAAQARLSDQLHVRLVSVPGALAARSWASAADVVLDVTDASCPWNAGRWRLSTHAGTCTSTDDEPDLALDVRVLGACHLGASRPSELGGAGLVQERTPGALAVLDAAYARTGPAPFTPQVF